MEIKFLQAYEAPQVMALDLQAEESLLVPASINGGTPPVPGAGDGGSMGDDYWG